MRVLQINKFLYRVGGAETYMFDLSKELEKRGHEVDYWGMSDPRNIVEDKFNTFCPNIDFNSLTFGKQLKASLSTIYSRRNRLLLKKHLDCVEPDIVHIHNFNFQLTPSILKELKRRGIKVVHTTHDSQLVCPWHRLYNFKIESTCTKCVEGSFLNCVKDRCFNDSTGQSVIGAMESIYYHNQNFYNKNIDVIISPSNFLKNLLKSRISVPIEVIPNFTSFERTNKMQEKRDYILYFGRISKEKGILNLIQRLDKSGVPIKVIGTGPQANDLALYSFVEYLGPQYGKDLVRYIEEAKFVIQPSVWFENCPMTVVESMCLGTPVIASKHSGFLELIENGRTGYLLDFSREDIAERILTILNSFDMSMVNACRESYKDRFRKEKHINRIESIYNKVLNGNI